MDPSLQEHVLGSIRLLKQGRAMPAEWQPIVQNQRTVAWLEPVNWLDADRQEAIELLANWRENAAHAFPSQFPVTLVGTHRWLIRQLLEVPDRLLFWVTGIDGTRVGHLGLFRFNFDRRQVEIDNVVRGRVDLLPGVMQAALETLMGWTFSALHMETLALRVFADNERAIQLYRRTGFHELAKTPMARIEEGDTVRWVEMDGTVGGTVDRYLTTMQLTQTDWMGAHPRAAA
jgi:RimJ/RimL family protein N-acetyltransferase